MVSVWGVGGNFVLHQKLLHCMGEVRRAILQTRTLTNLSECSEPLHMRSKLCLPSSSSVALQPGVGLGLLYNTPPSLLIPCSVSPFVYSHLSQVRGHVIQPSPMCQMSSLCFQSFVSVGYSLCSEAYCKVL